MYAVAFITPFSTVPQIITLFQTKVATGLSLQTWIMYLLFGMVPLAYAIINKIKPLIISNVLWTIIDLIMIVGIIKFGSLAGPSSYEKLLFINNIGKTMAGLGLICLTSAAALFGYDLANSNVKKANA